MVRSRRRSSAAVTACEAIARLKPGVTIAQAQADLATIAANLEKQYPDSNTYFGVAAKPLREDLIGDVRTALYVLFGAVICVLLIANANVANLLARARFGARKRDGVARGHGREPRRESFGNCSPKACCFPDSAASFGLLFAQWGTEALIKTVPENIPRISNIQLDASVLIFTLLVSLATGVIFGLVPAWQASHVDLNSSLKSGTRTGGGGESKGRLRNGWSSRKWRSRSSC